MKKIIYISLLILITGLTFSSCTEEEVAPTTELNGGGSGTGDPLK
ncbi:MAG TPA: hypothetical protein VL443_05760 [Cyclobacteriaceae bacterium]|nr:hypothetical protein [Cyclobacteriaceae bacterium]